MSNSAACREVGINRRAGTRWRYGRKEVDRTGRERVYAPITEERHRDGTSDRFLAEDERLVIADLLRSGNSLRAIARELGRSRPRSAGRCGATATRTPANTTPSRHSAGRP
ncbi:helix-turn-helix domain-containing protein [Streptomyces mirabilis]|uniref:helix-turn-helix domain-containing protein n=1 Tax=Streptomyces mirabilis TaxID=68239 RepID=UPI0036F08FFD